MNDITNLALLKIHPKWRVLLNTPTKSGELLMDILDRTITTIAGLGVKLCPDNPHKILRCLQLDPDKIKVVIIGQDPFPTPGIATGLAFGCTDKAQPSLEIIKRELHSEFPFEDFDNSLEQWEQQGVLLLNSALSCEQFKAGSHAKLWEEFIAGLITILNDFKITREEMTSLVFVFLGGQAKMYLNEVSEKLHYVITRYHPVAEAYGANKFTGFFNEVNIKLIESGQTEIQWI